MTRFRSKIFLLLAFILVTASLTGCAVSLAADVTPPPNAQSFSVQDTPAAVSASLYPIVPPDPARGQAIYLEKCAPCHGEQGMGDGSQGSQLPVPVPPLGDGSLARGVRPVEWYQMVTQGNMERFMPGFRSLDDRQRWDVVAYALTLSMRADTLEEGKTLYEANCLSCHGSQGQGSSGVPGWRDDTARMAQFSLSEMEAVTANGKGNMPAYGDTFSQAQLAAVNTYIRTLSFSGEVQGSQAVVEPAATATAQAEGQVVVPVTEGSLMVTGKVSNGSGGVVPSGLVVELTGYDGMTEVVRQEIPVGEDGSYASTEIELLPGRTFIASLNYNGFTYNSDVYHNLGEPLAGPLDLPITIFDTTTDTSALRADRMHVFFDFTDPEFIQVAELFLLNNTGTRVIVASQPGGGVASFDLPAEATGLQFQDGVLGGRYIQTETGFADTAVIPPGSGSQVLFAYNLPYKRKVDIEIPVNLPVDAAVVMVPQGTMTLESSQLQAMGQRDIQGVQLDIFTTTSLQPGSRLAMTLSGRVANTASIQAGQTSGLIAGAVILVLAVAGVGYWFFRQRKPEANEEESDEQSDMDSPESIMDAIIALDDRYKAGEIPEEAYQQRREALKSRLKSLSGQ